MLLLLLVLSLAECQKYCQCVGGFFYDAKAECLTSSTYGVENACYICPIVNASGQFDYCGSLYALGYGLCDQGGAVAARTSACAGFGGNTASAGFKCLSNTGSNLSQVIACNGTGTGTGAPTSTGAVVTPMSVLYVLGLFLFTYVTA